jgi:hypothetical protein
MSDSNITLPPADEMLARLRSVIDERYLVEDFYPQLLKYAGSVKTVEGLELMITLAIFDYTEDLPETVAAGLLAAMPLWIQTMSEAL